ncbi:hypothetical protein ACFX2A_002779 [Malus domestica]
MVSDGNLGIIVTIEKKIKMVAHQVFGEMQTLKVQARELRDKLESEILGNHQDNRKPCFYNLHGENDLAREALKRHKSFADSGNILKSQLDQQKTVIDNLVSNTRLLKSKIQEARSKKDTLKLRIMGVAH